MCTIKIDRKDVVIVINIKFNIIGKDFFFVIYFIDNSFSNKNFNLYR